jgi:hypothetical protein
MERLCRLIVRGLRELGPLDHYSFQDFRDIAANASPSHIGKVVLYLAAPGIDILKPCLLYEVAEGEVVELPEEAVDDYIEGRSVRHPVDGLPIDSAELLISFLPGDALTRSSIAKRSRSA